LQNAQPDDGRNGGLGRFLIVLFMFVDHVKIRVRGGDGGNGCVSFRREKYVPRGGPDGGDGGRGGDVILRASRHVQSLIALYYKPHCTAGNGKHGKGSGCHGARGQDCIVDVPLGTVVRSAQSGELLADLDEEGSRVVVARGGRGGRGNAAFATSTNRAPREAEPGEPGEERELELELKTVADVGLVGFPNAGKSSFLKAVSHAHPKTAPYPFTTLTPVVGVVEFPDFFRMTIADIPGLIEGAHRNVGLGHEFLRHIERAPLLLFIVDAAGVDGRTPWDDVRTLQRELALHDPNLVERPALVFANKMDLPGAEENLERLRREVDLEVFAGSVLENRGLQPVIEELRRRLEAMPEDVRRLRVRDCQAEDGPGAHGKNTDS